MPPAYSVEVQAKIPATLCAIHNSIWQFDPSEGQVPADNIGSFGYGNNNEDIGGNDDTSDAGERKLQRICGEIIKRFWQKEGGLTAQMRIHKRNHLALMNGMRKMRVIKDE